VLAQSQDSTQSDSSAQSPVQMDDHPTPIAGNLTPEQIEDANDAAAQAQEADKAVAAARSAANADASNRALWQAFADAQATAARYWSRWYAFTGYPAPPCGNSGCDPGP
jgi:hypothetical protein